jgi:dipeptidyl aminopeptidase/acylaminoacyl peptidase
MSRLALLLASNLLLVPSASRPPDISVDAVFDSLARVHRFHDVAISPDGKRVAWSVKVRDRDGRDRLGAISVSDLTSGQTRRLAAMPGGPAHDEHDAAFSPDGAWIAFLSDAAEKDQAQVWIVPAAGGAARQLTRVRGQLDHLRWSADGASIAFLFVEGSRQKTGALVAYKRDAGVVEETVEEQRIAVAPVRTGRVRLVSPANLYVYDYDWSADGKTFAAEAAVGSGTNNYWIAELYLVAADTGAARSIWKPPLQIACPRFSPDGKSIAVIHGLMSDEGSTGGDIWVVPVSGQDARNLTPEWKASARALFWRTPDEILFPEAVDGGRGVALLDPGTGRMSSLWTGDEALDDLAVAGSGTVSAGVVSSFRKPPEVSAGPIGQWKVITSVNAGMKPFWGEAKSLHWQSDGATAQGWLLYPLNFDPSRDYPMVVSIHGGPSADQSIAWPSRWNGTFPSQGYFVFLPNPRGSYGFGEAFTRANVKDFGGGDLRDVLSGIDEVLRAAPVDGTRVGIVGWSYGGYMAMWAVTQTTRFAAAVAGAGIADWRSYYGQNKIDTWMLPFFGASVYDDPAVYARSSPIEFIKKVKTPTLVLHGERDSEVPTPQGYEFWHALKSLGVDTQLAIYTDEGHDIQQPEHQRDIVRRAVAWLDKYLKKGAAQ